MKETRIILSLIYRDYLCLPEKRQELLEKDREILKKEEKNLREKYAINFEERNKKNKEITINESSAAEEVQLIKYKNTFFKRIINKIFEFLHIKP